MSGPRTRLGRVQIDVSRDAPGVGRVALVNHVLTDVLPTVARTGSPARVLDCGGGSGTYAVPLARAGADVTVVDISVDALATLHRRAVEAGVADRIHPVQGDAEASDDLAGLGPFDLVLAHGILEAVDDVHGVLAGVAAAVRPGGLVSVLVDNPAAAVMARALGGEPALALTELRDLAVTSARRGPEAVRRLCADAGLAVELQQGVGVFSDLVPGSALDAPGARDALAALDAEAAGLSPFAEIAGRVHLLVRRR
jgi:S-adenosylmethionine-dependent methyltransferase